MAIHDLFSKRMKRERGEFPDVYQYHHFPETLKVQIIHIWTEQISESSGHWDYWYKVICKERGIFSFNKNYFQFDDTPFKQITEYFISEPEAEQALDPVELVAQQLHLGAIDEINARFQEHGFGYQLENGHIIRVDSKLLHADVTKPTLNYLSQRGFEGPNQEFLSAHEHYRHGRYKECLVDCLKAFESTLKVICDKQKWGYDQHKDTASRLLQIVFDNGLLPSWLQTEFTSLRTTLESGVPTVRNKTAGHGHGATPTQVPPYMASYVLHLTATNILLLVDAYKALNGIK